MSVITISREFGSEGSLIAEKAAQALGYHLADKATIEAILRPEYGTSEFLREYGAAPGFWDRFDLHRMDRRQQMIEALNKAILALARHGHTVIVGRGGFSVLEGLADVLHVRVQAPLPVRIQRVRELPEAGVASRAERFIQENDRVQKAFIESVYGVPWDSAKRFDLVLDTGKLALDTAVAMLLLAVKALDAAPPKGLNLASSLGVDHIYAATIEELFHCAPASVG